MSNTDPKAPVAQPDPAVDPAAAKAPSTPQSDPKSTPDEVTTGTPAGAPPEPPADDKGTPPAGGEAPEQTGEPCPICFPFGVPEGSITFGCSHS
jgi:hypothetical protein